jgi:hypothetical protein
MKAMRQQKSWMALLALLFIFAACKGESPTAPPPGGGPGPAPTPTGVNLTLTASNANPVVDSIVVITATVTQNGQPVPNGTAVEFSASGGTFSATEIVTSILRTTTNGVATVELRSTVAGPITVQAVVGNVTRTVGVTFRIGDVIPPPINTTPSITSVTPAIGVPTGGERVRIIGKNFKEPVRVLFNTGAALPVEAFVTRVSDTEIEVFTPSVNIGVDQQLIADIIVITQAGSVNEQRATLEDAFTFRNEVLTPRISTASPNSGPVTGGTRVTIFGDGFQHPVQVLFGTAEAHVVTVEFGQIIVEAPSARDTSPDGSGTVTGPVDIIVRNINSQTSTTLGSGFLYKAAMQITAAGPTEGPFTGGTTVSIDGIGFVAPVAVTIGGVAAQPISVTGTKVIARTAGVQLAGCGDVPGEIRVTNIVNGDSATGPLFTFRVPQPIVVNVDVDDDGVADADPGDSIGVIVANALPGVNRITVGNRTVFITATTLNSDGTTRFEVTLPTNFTFTTEECAVGGVEGERFVPLVLDVTYLNVNSSCTNTADQVLTIVPPDTSCRLPPPPPPAEVTLTNPVGGACADAGPVAVGSTTPGTATITFRNDGGQTLTIARGVISGTDAADFSVLPSSASIEPGQVASFTVSFDPDADPAPPSDRTASVQFTTNDADEPSINVCLQGRATP